jgi:hypothetical protein
VAELADPARLAALGAGRLVRFGATRGLRIRRADADRLGAAARDALPMPDAPVARAVLAADLALLAEDARQPRHRSPFSALDSAQFTAALLSSPGGSPWKV